MRRLNSFLVAGLTAALWGPAPGGQPQVMGGEGRAIDVLQDFGPVALGGDAEDANDAPPAGDAKPVDPKKAALTRVPSPRIDVRPNSLQINSYVSFNEQGVQQSSQTSCNLGLMVSCDPHLNPVSYKNLQLTRIVTDTGAELAIPDNSNQAAAQLSVQPGDRARFGMNFVLPTPPPNAKSFAEITGKMTLQCAVGPIKQAALPVLKESAGKRIRIEGLAGELALTISRNDEPAGRPGRVMTRVGIELPNAAAPLLAGARFTDAAGNDINAQDSGTSSNGTSMTRYYYLQASDTTKIILSFHHKLEEVETPFTIRDIGLPQAPPAKGGELTVKAVTPVQAAAEAAKADAGPAPGGGVEAKPDPGALRAVVETK